MKILQVCDTFYPDVDGPIDVMVNIAREFNLNGWGEVDLLVPSYPEKIEVDGLKIHRCKSFPACGYRACIPAADGKIKKLFRAKAGEEYGLIHLHSPFPLARYALKAAKKAGIPVVITVHTKFEDELKNRVKVKFIRNLIMNYLLKTISSCDAITSVSKGMKDTLYDYGFKGRQKINVIYNSANAVRADAESAAELRKKIVPDGGFAFLFAGRLVKVKNVQFSLEVLSVVKSRGYGNFKFYIAGEGEYEKTLKKLTAKFGLGENVIFLGKITDKKQLSEYYSACDALLFPSVFDNSSVTVIEAAVNSLPAVTIKNSDSAERITDGENGFVWGYDVNLWAYNLIELMKNREAFKKAGAGARESLYLSPESVALKYRELYERTAGNFKK